MLRPAKAAELDALIGMKKCKINHPAMIGIRVIQSTIKNPLQTVD
jgi:hypothetical protein